jgi:hypothetical protein
VNTANVALDALPLSVKVSFDSHDFAVLLVKLLSKHSSFFLQRRDSVLEQRPGRDDAYQTADESDDCDNLFDGPHCGCFGHQNKPFRACW